MHEEKTLVFRLEVLFVALRLSRAGFTARPETRSTPGAACARAVKEPMRFTCRRWEKVANLSAQRWRTTWGNDPEGVV